MFLVIGVGEVEKKRVLFFVLLPVKLSIAACGACIFACICTYATVYSVTFSTSGWRSKIIVLCLL